MRELSIGDAIALASMPPSQDEAACTALLRRAVESVKGEADPALWTVQERIMAVCHYLAVTCDDGPDFSVGGGRYSDYLDGAAQGDSDSVLAGELEGDEWHVCQLTGAMVEAIERVKGEISGIDGRLHWLLGGMAAQLYRPSESIPDATGGEYDEWLAQRMRVLASFPESDFAKLLLLYQRARSRLHHLFAIEFSSEGIVAVPKEGAANVDLPPARFPASACLSKLAIELAGANGGVSVEFGFVR